MDATLINVSGILISKRNYVLIVNNLPLMPLLKSERNIFLNIIPNQVYKTMSKHVILNVLIETASVAIENNFGQIQLILGLEKFVTFVKMGIH